MNREALRELFDYTTFTWAALGESVRSLPAEAFAQPVEGSGWPSLRNALFHIAAAWDGWICEQTGNELKEVEREDMTTWDELDAIRSTIRPLLRQIIDETPDEAFDTPGPAVSGRPGSAPSEIIAHILLHERGHHGDLSTLLHALGANSSSTDYLVYVFANKR
jgi:uncharacterized damage-inducible protein DinB